jgi:signal transduction histidine kinase
VNLHLQISQAVLGAILESPPDIVIFALDRDYRYLAYNQNHARTIKLIWGVDIHVGMSMLHVIGREDDRLKARRNFDRALQGESFTLREEYGDESMRRRVYEDVYSPIRADDGEVVGLTVYLTDITEQKAAELELDNYRCRLEELVRRRTSELEAAHAQLLYAQKLESLGVLAGGVAHDFNNLLAVILARAELAGPSLCAEHPAHGHFEIIRETALEARMLTRQLLAYSGKGRFMIQAVDPTAMIESMASLLRASIPDTVQLTFDFCASSSVVRLDVTQARQVILNLVTNAAEAIEGEGQVVVRTRLVDADDRLLAQACIQSDVGPGRYAAIEVQDTGCGMDREVRTRLFDPFFTTKLAGRGLGLAAVLGIVKTHRGALLLRTAPHEGSTFTVLLPLASTAS